MSPSSPATKANEASTQALARLPAPGVRTCPAARSRRAAGRNLACALALLLLAASACSEDNAGKADAKGDSTKDSGAITSPDATIGDAPAVVPDGGVCAPGTTDGCATEHHVKRCAPDGSGWIQELCTDDTGQITTCIDPGLCTVCQPGDRRCNPKDSLQVQTCNVDGQWEVEKTCDAQKGVQCLNNDCQKACDFNAKAKSYTGCSFWATDLDNAFVPGGGQSYYDAANSQYAIVVSNPSDKLASVVEIYSSEGKEEYDSQGDPLDYSPLQPGELRVFNLKPRNINATTLEPLAWRVTASSPIAVYQFNPLENVNVYSNDASLLLPDEVLGKYYIVMSREQSFSVLRGFLTVVGTFPGKTKVTITLSQTAGVTLKSSDGTIKSMKAGEAASFELNQWDVLNIETDVVGSDLTGSVVQADRAVAVFAGSEAANAPNTNHCLRDACTAKQLEKGEKCGVCEWDDKTPCGNNDHCSQFITCCADHLEMQMFPVKTWGSHYVGVKLKPRGNESDSWRILAATNETKVVLVPPQKDPHTGKPINVPVLNAGEWFEFESGKGQVGGNFEIIAQHEDGSPAPVLVGHFMQSQDSPGPGAQPGDAGTGDPAFLLAIPVEQWRTDYVFLTPSKYNTNFVSIAAPADAEVLFDGEPIAPDLFANITDKYKYTRLFVNPGTHTIRALPVKGPDGVMQPRRVAVDVYGFDQYVSYGYPAGLDLKELTLFKEPGE